MHDVFVSYSSEDREWATLVADELKQEGLDVFLDTLRLDAGRAWEPQVLNAVRNSRHMIVLWSKKSKDSPWVSREQANFEGELGDSKASDRRLIFLMLDETRSAYSSLQAVNDLIPHYADGAANLPAAAKTSAIKKLVEAVRVQDGSIAIPVVVLTLTSEDLQQLDRRDWQVLSEQLNVTEADLANRYGPKRSDWKPFGGEATIEELLDGLRKDMNKTAREELGDGKAVQFRWEPVRSNFWSDRKIARDYARRFSAAPVSLVILDAVALIQDDSFRRLLLFQELLTNRRTATLVVPPFPADQRYLQLQKWLDERGTPYFDPYFRPLATLQRLLSAQCGFGTGDAEEMCRRVMVAVGQFVAEHKTSPQPPYVRVGT